MKGKIWFAVAGFVTVLVMAAAALFFAGNKAGIPLFNKGTAAAPKMPAAIAAGETAAAPAAAGVIDRTEIEKLRGMIQQGDYEGGIAYADELLKRGGKTAEVLGLLGDVYLEKKEFLKAGEYFAQAIGQDASNPWFLKGAGMAAWGTGKMEQAKDYFTRTIAADTRADKSEAAYAYMGLSWVYQSQNNIDKALENIKKAISFQPRNKVFAEELKNLTEERDK